ncbi:hypothetical protein H9C73_02905 [Marinobacterium sp. AK62]|uniref:Uncharacterized protein n=1 Tax=Marinobacterium alkalitolerans TaxID=1542925 RepID=A0ABS3Z7K8_9GAMM|nr:hypothetical protein [Marinobacterium alkalitolerans]MBP0047673.1 hypothetical protein [Marinobacterium alkalitolerans]
MTTQADRKTEILKMIAANPGITPGELVARSVTCNKAEVLKATLKALTKDDAFIMRTGLNDSSHYWLTERGTQEAKELGFEVSPLERECPEPAKPLPVVDSDKTSLEQALAQLGELVAEQPRPVNLHDLISFNRQGADLIQHQAPVPAAMMRSTANALERAYQQGQ